jgi:3-(methylthio)propanoyl-CoA dehydrogenase
MSQYRAPLKEIEFALLDQAGLAHVAALPGYQEATPDVVCAVLEEADRFAREVLAPLNGSGDREGARYHADSSVAAPAGYPEAYRKFITAGWNRLTGDPRYEGQGFPQLVSVAVQEIWNGANLAFCLVPLLTASVLEAFRHHASAEQQARFMPKLTSGIWTGTMNLTEPQAGSDLSAVRMQAVAEGDHYRLRGTKIFITWGEHDLAENIVHLVLARTPHAPAGVRGISLFIVPKFLVHDNGTRGRRNDIRCISLEHKMGIRATPTCVLAYGETEGAIGYLLGEENRGLEYMFTTMNIARLAVGVQGFALAEAAYQHARAHAMNRVQGRPIGQKNGTRVAIVHHPDVRRMLLEMKAFAEAGRALAYAAAAALDHAQRHPDAQMRRRSQSRADLLTPVVKGWCTERAVEAASLGIQVHGGMGYIEETGAAQYLRDARITTIYEGTTGIQANDLTGRKIVRDSGAAALALCAEMRELDAPLARASSVLDVSRRHLQESIGVLEAATRWLVDRHSRAPAAVAAVSVPYLDLLGTVAGGACMLQAAAIAGERLSDPDADEVFLSTKIATARFYGEHILPRARALGEIVLAGAESVVDFDAARL